MKTFREIYLTEKESLLTMRNNYSKVFPYSKAESEIVSSNERDLGLQLMCSGIIASSSGKDHKVQIQFHRADKSEPYTINSKVEIRCDCKAFRYNVSYPLTTNKNLFGTVNANFKIPNKIHNSKKIPTFCKHIYSYIRYLLNKGVIHDAK